MTSKVINRLNKLGKEESEEEGIVCTDMQNRVTVNNIEFDLHWDCLFGDYIDDSNASDKNFMLLENNAFDKEIEE